MNMLEIVDNLDNCDNFDDCDNCWHLKKIFESSKNIMHSLIHSPYSKQCLNMPFHAAEHLKDGLGDNLYLQGHTSNIRPGLQKMLL